MKAVFLDDATLGDDVSLMLEESFHLQAEILQWTFYKETKASETLGRLKDADIVVTNKVVLTEEILKQCSQLKLICVAATGYNNIDISAAVALHMTVCNVPGYSTDSVAQLVMTFILSFSFNLVAYSNDVKEGKWQKQAQFCLLSHSIHELKGKKLGIIGYGNLGKQVAVLAENFGMKILIASHSDPRKKQSWTLPLEQVIEESDFITLHVPLNAQTENLITRTRIERMKPTSFLINTARGGIVNEKDLAECLKEKRIAGAAVDVLTKEPPTSDNPLLDLSIPNLLLTPHIGWASYESRMRLVEALKENIQAFLQGYPKNVVTVK